MIQGNPLTWLMTRIGPATIVRVDVDGPMGLEEIEHLKKNLDLASKWATPVTPEAGPEPCKSEEPK